MNTAFFTRLDSAVKPLGLPEGARDVEPGQEPERWDTVFRRLSRLESGKGPLPGETGTVLRSADSPGQNGTRRFSRRVRYVLIDRTGPLGDFESWDDAFQYMEANHVNGGNIVRSEGLPGDRPGSAEGVGNTNSIPRMAGLVSPRNPSSGDAVKKVLVIEDEVFTLLSLTQIVKSSGHSVVIARNAAEAVDAIRLERPALILTDINLTVAGQGWDGFGVISWMNFHYPGSRTKCIVVSGGDCEILKPRAAAVGAFAFLSKPLEKELLLGEIRRAIGDPSPSLSETAK